MRLRLLVRLLLLLFAGQCGQVQPHIAERRERGGGRREVGALFDHQREEVLNVASAIERERMRERENEREREEMTE